MENVITVDFGKKENAFDYEAYRRRAEKRLTASLRRKAIVAAAESLSALLIGVCGVVCTLVAVSMF